MAKREGFFQHDGARYRFAVWESGLPKPRLSCCCMALPRAPQAGMA